MIKPVDNEPHVVREDAKAEAAEEHREVERDGIHPHPLEPSHGSPNDDPRINTDAESWDPSLPPVQGDPRKPTWPENRAQDPVADQVHKPTGPDVG